MIAGHSAGPITSPRCSRSPAIRPELMIWRTAEVCHDVAIADATSVSFSQIVNARNDSPARYRSTISRTTAASSGRSVILSSP